MDLLQPGAATAGPNWQLPLVIVGTTSMPFSPYLYSFTLYRYIFSWMSSGGWNILRVVADGAK